jgi:pyridoxal 5'-phosphate synthase pdxT subunit
MSSRLNVGVLALQGDFERHLFRLSRLDTISREVRRASDLAGLDGLIIPGGESSTMSLLLDRFDMREELKNFCTRKAVWGTCAGMILLAREVDDARVSPLGIIDIGVRRNAYGRQVHSFHTPITALTAAFIRAPQVDRVGVGVTILAEYQKSPVLLQQGNCLVSSFHTELDDDLNLTKYFLKNIVSVFK